MPVTFSQRFRLNCELEAVAHGYPPSVGQIYSDVLILVAANEAVPEAIRLPLMGWLGLLCPELGSEELKESNNFMIDVCVDVFERLKVS